MHIKYEIKTSKPFKNIYSVLTVAAAYRVTQDKLHQLDRTQILESNGYEQKQGIRM